MTRKHALSVGGILLALVLCVSYIFASVLKTPLLSSAPTVLVDLPRTGGLFAGSEATYRGVRIGKVRAIELTSTGVRATVALAGGTEIPADTDVRVRSLSPVGEQYLDFEPSSDKAPFLKDGDVLEATATDLPESLGNMAITLKKLIDQVDPKQIGTVLDELDRGLSGTSGDLRQLIDDGNSLLGQLNQNLPVTQRLLRNSRTLLVIGAEEAPELRSLATNAQLFAAWLRGYDPTFFDLLKKAPGQLKELRAMVKDIADTAPQLLDSAVTLTDILAARDPHLRELLLRFPQGFAALGNAIHDGAAHLDVILQNTDACDYSTDQRGPREASYRAPQSDGRCSTSLAFSQRGAQFAPRPTR